MSDLAYSQSFVAASGTGPYAYNNTIPGAMIGRSGQWARLKLSTAPDASLSMQNSWVGRSGSVAGSFDGSQAPVTVGGQTSWTIPAGQSVWTDPLQIAVVAGVGIVHRYDIPGVAGQKYPYRTGVLGSEVRYKAGSAGAANGTDATGEGYSSLAGWSAILASIEVAATADGFDAQPAPPSLAIDSLEALEKRAMANRLFAAGQLFPGVSEQRQCMSLQVAADKPARAFIDMIEVTLTADSEVTLRSFLAPSSAVVFNSHCNVNFDPSGAPGPASRVRHWLSTSAPEAHGGRHTTYMLRGNQRHQLFAPRGFLGLVHPGGSGLTLVVHEAGVGIHASWEWHETPL